MDQPEQASPLKLSDAEIEQLIMSNYGLAIHIANSWKNQSSNPGLDADDVNSQALQGLVKAANEYAKNPEAGPFVPYAARAIRNHLGHQSHWQRRHKATQPGEMDAPIGDPGEGDDSTMHDKVGDPTSRDSASTFSRAEAERIINDELEKLEPKTRGFIKRWLNGESYRDMQADSGISFVQVGNIVRAGLKQLRQALEIQGYDQLADIWTESIIDEMSGKDAYEILLSAVEVGLSDQQVNTILRG